MFFIPKLGIIGNIEEAFRRNQKAIDFVFEEQEVRERADKENREAVEHALTDLYLDGVQAQQDITDIQLQLLEG